MNDPTDAEKVTGGGIPRPNDKSNPIRMPRRGIKNAQPKKKIDIENARRRALELAKDSETNGEDPGNVDAKTLQKQAKENITKRIAELKSELSEMRVDASPQAGRHDAAKDRLILEKLDESIYSLKYIGYSSIGDRSSIHKTEFKALCHSARENPNGTRIIIKQNGIFQLLHI